MTIARPHSSSPYMEFAKLHSAATFNLATSGMMAYPLAELPVTIEDLEINGPTRYGWEPLQERIARMKGVSPDCVVHATGTSMANHLAMSAIFAPGDEVLIEEPTYELLLSTALYLGAKIRRFGRRTEDGYSVDPEAIARQVTPATRAIILTNLHNPTSALISNDTLREVGAIARSVGARVLVDEVYLEALYGNPVPTSLTLGDEFVVTSSLTKAYGLSGLRCGWILAEPELASSIWRLNDLFGASTVHTAERLSVIAIDNLARIAARAEKILSANRTALRATLEGHAAIEVTIPHEGTTVFPRLKAGNVEGFCAFLREKYETSVVPGAYFERPESFRVGLGGEVEMTRVALERLADALTAWAG
jgi:aspartate/methionine/tyrosine aminotransferase